MRSPRRGLSILPALVASGTFLGAAASPGVARADEPFPARAERLGSPGRSMVTEDSAEALVLNPANLANLPGRELRWTGIRCPDTRRASCGHAVDVASPLLFGLSTGLRLDWAMPPDGARGVGFPVGGADYVWLTWGLAYKLGERVQVGASLQGSWSSNPFTDGLFGLTAGVSYRPSTRYAFSAVLHDMNGPSSQALPPRGFPVLDRSYGLGLAMRPTGTRAFEVGVEARYFEGQAEVPGYDGLRPRATVGLDVPGVGRVRGDLEIQNVGSGQRFGWVGSAGLELAYSKLTAGGGMLFGSGLGSRTSIGQYATASITDYLTPGIPRSRRGVYMRLEATPGNRSHVRLLRRLWKLAEDPEVASVTLLMRTEPATSFAHAEELADAFRVLRAHGKKVVCSFEDNGAKALYACASADRIVVNPAGGVRYSGLRTQHIYLAGLLNKLGVKAEFVRIGAHKSAPEQFTNEHASDTARADQEDLLRNVEAVFDRNLSLYRKLSESHVREATKKGPFVASEAKAEGFVDGYAFDDEMERVTEEVVGRDVAWTRYEDEPRAPQAFGPRDRVAVLYLDGDIIDGRSRTVPILGMKLVGSYSMAESIKALRDDARVKAVVLRIESPGGSSMASDVMWRELDLLAKRKPLVVSMGSIAASGGYYVAAPAHRIFALPLTITGSIGIFYGKADVSGLLEKVGVNVETRKTTPRADAESFFRGFTDDERVELRRKVGQFYDVFLDRVAKGRHLTKEQVDKVGQGRVWAGQQAVQNGLVDEMGGLRHALATARKMAKLPDDAPIVELPPPDTSLLGYVLKLAGLDAGVPLVSDMPVQVKNVLRAVAPITLTSDATPMARMEWTPVGEDDAPDDAP